MGNELLEYSPDKESEAFWNIESGSTFMIAESQPNQRAPW
jgi:hypothetical protein